MTPTTAQRPTKEDVDFVLESLRPRIEALLREEGCSPAAVAALIRELTLVLTHRAIPGDAREPWLLAKIERAVRST
jgi:hypothetical protein